MTADPSHYESIAYESFAYLQSHPNRLAAVATLFGMKPRPAGAARVLEVGCASGGNLLPMAAALPGSEFTGVDLSPKQIAAGQACVDAVGLTNVRLHATNLADIDASFGRFDYIIAHGVYSWVPADVREKLMALCARSLTPEGIAYISFNTLPGSSTRAAIREMARFHTRGIPSPADQIAHARALLEFFSSAFGERNDAYAQTMRDKLAELADSGDFYIAHEYLEETNYPCYFHEFAGHAGAHGLQFLGESEVHAMAAADLSLKTRAGLREVAAGLIEAEQYLDFLRNRAFRQTILCRAEVALKRSVPPSLVEQFHFTSSARPAGSNFHVRSNAPAEFRTANGVAIKAADPLAKAALYELGAVSPRTLTFSELASKAGARAGVPEAPGVAATLSQFLLKTIATSPAIEFTLTPPVFEPDVSARPATTALARWQAANGRPVTNARHENIFPGSDDRELLALLDGTRDLATLTRACPEAPEILARFAGAALLTG